MGSFKVIMMRFLCLFDKPKKKFVLTNRYIIRDGVRLYRIKCTKSFGPVKEGEYGGYVEGEYNLSQRGFAWVYGDACVFGNAKLLGNAKVCDSACVYGSAIVCDNAKVFDNACVSDNAIIGDCAKVYGNAGVYGNAKVYGSACVYDKAKVYGDALVYGDAKVYDKALVYGDANVSGNAEVSDKAMIYGNANVSDNAEILDKAKVYDHACIFGDARISGNACIENNRQYYDFDCFILGDNHVHVYLTKDKKIEIRCGGFCGDIEAFEKIAKGTGDENECQAIIAIIKKRFSGDESLDNITKNHDYNCLVTGNKNINECPIKDKIEIMCDRFCRVELEVLRRKRQEEIKETKRIFQGISDIIKKGFGLDEKR